MRIELTSRPVLLSLLLLPLALVSGGCHGRAADQAVVGRYGGYTTLGYDGPLADIPPVEAVDFSTHRGVVTDDDLEAMFPALQRLNPRRICLGGQRITDRSIDLLNRLPYLRVVNLEGTDVTPAGWGRLHVSHFQ